MAHHPRIASSNSYVIENTKSSERVNTVCKYLNRQNGAQAPGEINSMLLGVSLKTIVLSNFRFLSF